MYGVQKIYKVSLNTVLFHLYNTQRFNSSTIIALKTMVCIKRDKKSYFQGEIELIKIKGSFFLD